jgi:tetratricopeptide (TPR) repeat protein
MSKESWVEKSKPTKEQEEWAARLVDGQITLAEYVGLSKKELYIIAQQGYQLLNSGKLEEAQEIYEGLVAADPYDSVFHCHLGAVLVRMGKEDEALEHFNSSIQFNIANIDALSARGEIYLRQNKIAEAVADLKRAVELDPQGKRPSTVRARAALLSLKTALENNNAEAKTQS